MTGELNFYEAVNFDFKEILKKPVIKWYHRTESVREKNLRLS